MSNNAPRSRGPQGWLPLVAVGAGVVVVGVVVGSLVLGGTLTGLDQTVPANPVEALIRLVQGELVWPLASTVIAAVLTVLVVVAAVLLLVRRGGRRRGDAPARSMTPPGQLREVTGPSAKAKAARLRPGTQIRTPRDYGLQVGVTVQGNRAVYLSWEDVGTILAGPRMGKTAAVAIPAVCDAPGAVIATSNKADLHHHTRGVREQVGTVWVSDLQGIADESGPQWWWDPLAGVSSILDARELARYFIGAATNANNVGNDYFDGGSQELFALYLLAAAAAGGDVVHTLSLLNEEDSEIPRRALSAGGHVMAAAAVRRAQQLNQRQRDGLYDMARRYLAVLAEPSYARSVVPPQRTQLADDPFGDIPGLAHDLPQFDPVAFVASSDTLYALSLEGPSSAAGLNTALVGRIFDAAQQRARRSPAGRLPTPLVAVLDEAANICKLTDLPDQYSHFGGQGIVVLTVLQSPAQARKVWTVDQFDALRSASNIEFYGGGISDTTYLESLSRRVGDHDVSRWSDSVARRGEGSRSQSWSREAILSVEALAALPKDRALVLSSGNAPVLVRKTFWQDSPHADGIRASLARYDTTAAGRDGVDQAVETAR